ncbi:YhcN/YlaJ family sporulation lipoprotein [Bacillus taeanensis]|uniref:YhcN/YlaJ family sporulation lipoprotein n=1 Tax=Bacillus taeanensis TaxID=273032 RepID=UPI0026A417A1
MKRLCMNLILCFLLLIGCQNSAQENAQENTQSQNDLIHVKQTVPKNGVEEKSASQIAEHLVEIATAVPDVDDATAIVTGKYAVVGIDVNRKLDRSRVGTIKYTVAEALKKDPYGANAVVTADIDTVYRLRQMAKQIKQGHPISGIMEELSAIVGRIVPEVPTDIKGDTPNPTETGDKQLPKEEEQQLEKQQEKQDLNR